MKNIDLELVAKAKKGDEGSFSVLYEQFAPSLYRTALYTLGNSHDAEDVVSETFLEAFHGIRKLRDNAAFPTWLFKILSVRCKRKIRDYVRGRNELDIDSLLELDDGSDLGQEASRRTDLLRAMEQLSAAERQIVVLAAVEGYTTKEVAQILGCPHGTVSSKLFRSLKKLRAILEK